MTPFLTLLAATLALAPGKTEVVVAKDASRATQIAAEEATNLLSRALGAAVPLVNRPASGKSHVYLGDSEWTRKAGIDVSALPRDGYRIKVSASGVFIAGIDSQERNPESIVKLPGEMEWGPQYERGTMFGLYAFLERFAGIRFYFPGELGTVIPQAKRLDVGSCDLTGQPDFTVRRWGYSDGKVPEELLAEFDGNLMRFKRANFYRLRMETKYLPCCHGLKKFRALQRFGKTHPEYFAQNPDGTRLNEPGKYRAGQLCHTSAITNEVYEDIKAYLQGRSVKDRYAIDPPLKRWPLAFHGNVIDVMPQDDMPPCHCPRCQAAYGKGANYADNVIWGFTCALAERLMKDGFKDFELTQMAYHPYKAVPPFDIPSCVRVMVASSGPYSMSGARKVERESALIHDWTAKTGRKVWLWNYPGKAMALNIPNIPDVCPKAWGAYYKHMAPEIFGAFAESETDRWLFHYLNYYVFSRVCWDNGTDVEATLAEHYRLMFGAAADEMRAFFDSLEDKWLNRVTANIVETPLGPMATPPDDRQLWTDIYSRETLAGYDRLLASAEGKVASGSLEARRIRLFREEYLGSLEKGSAAYHERVRLIGALKWRRGEAPMRIEPLPFGGRRHAPEPCATTATVERTADALVITCDCEEPLETGFASAACPHDDGGVFNDNNLEVILNPRNDRCTLFHFCVNTSGSWFDARALKFGKRPPRNDVSWESGARVEVKRRTGGWTATLRIPLAALGEVRDEFPMNICRVRVIPNDKKASGYYSWSPFIKEFRDVEHFGTVKP